MNADLSSLVRYYDRRYANPPGAMRNYAIYLEMARARAGDRLLDVGCGEGFLLAAAHQAGLTGVGVEITTKALRLAELNEPAAHRVCAAGEALPFRDGSFDLVTFIGTLEHFSNPTAGIREAARALRQNGRALVVVPNRQFIAWWFESVQGTEQQELSELLLDMDGWKQLVSEAGLKIERVDKEPWYTKPTPSRLKSWLRLLAWRVIPLRWTYQFAFLCRKA